MIFVFVAAETIRGSKRGIDLGFIQFQPSELGKVLFVLAIAGFLVERVGRVTRWRTIFSAIGLGSAPIVLLFLQSALGPALVVCGGGGVLRKRRRDSTRSRTPRPTSPSPHSPSSGDSSVPRSSSCST